MPSKEISTYFKATENRQTRDDLKRAIELVGDRKIAIDCGCGSGSDIAFLRSKQFQVHAFDIESEAIERCKRRFGSDKNVWLSQSTQVCVFVLKISSMKYGTRLLAHYCLVGYSLVRLSGAKIQWLALIITRRPIGRMCS